MCPCSSLGCVESSVGVCEGSPPVCGGTLVTGASAGAAPPPWLLAPPTVILPLICGLMSERSGQLCLAQHVISDPNRSQGARAKGFAREGLSQSNSLR